MSNLKRTFIQRSLEQYMNDVEGTIKLIMYRAGIVDTGTAVRSFAYKVVQQGAEGGVANLSFDQAVRFIDMGVGRAHPLGSLRGMKTTLLSQNKTGTVLKKNTVRKPKKIYSKIAYGKLTVLQNQLLYGYTEEVIAELKKEMEAANQPIG